VEGAPVMQELLLERKGEAWGELRLDRGATHWYTLENQDKRIPTGTYKVVLTPSGRAQAGKLWTPWGGFQLPELLNVPGRTAIRLHAANEEHELEGCIAPGMDYMRADRMLKHSRAALEALKDLLKFPLWITILAQPKE
jgi:hypothetical protein